MKKVLSLVLALVLVLGMIPTFADAHETGAQMLFENNFIVGDGTGDLMVEKVLTRDEMAVLMAQMYGKEVEAAAFVAPANFTDAAEFGWASNFISFGQASEWLSGFPDGTYRAKEAVTGKQLLSYLMQVLGYDFEWETIVADAAAIGLTVSTEGPILRGAAFETMWFAVTAIDINGEGMTIGEKTGKYDPTPVVVVTDLEVASVTATNLKTMVIEFNKAVDEATITSTTVKVMDGTTNVVASRLLSEDMMTLTVVYNTGDVEQSTELDLTIDGVKSLDGIEEIVDYEMTTVVTDVEIPTILGVSALNAKQLIVYFSEPLNTEAFSSVAYQVINDFKIDDVAVIAKVTPNYTENSAMFELSTILEPDTYEVKLANMIDFAGYKALTSTFNVTVVEDKAAPILTDAVVKNLKQIEITFDEALSVVGSFWIDGNAANAVVVPNSNGLKYLLTFDDLTEELNLSAVVQVKVEYKDQKDIVGNTVSAKTAFVFSIADDTTLPEVALEVKTGNKLVFTFSKTMLTNVGTLTIYDEDEEVVKALVTTNGTWSENNTIFTVLGSVALLNDVDVDDYTIEIEDMQDATVRKNLLPDTTIAFKALDTKKPVITDTYFVKNGTSTDVVGEDDTITFFFSEAMDTDTLKNLSNYNLTGEGLFSAITDVEVKSVASDAKSIVITYPSARDLVAGTDFITVYAFKDAAGNMMDTTILDRLVTTAMSVVSAEASVTNKVVVEFGNKMFTVDPSFIKIQKNGVDFAVPTMVTLNAAGTKATFTLNKAIETTTANYMVVTNTYTAAKNIYGDTLDAADAWTLTDKISPEFDNVAIKTGTTDTFVITFTEEVSADTTAVEYDLKIVDLTATTNKQLGVGEFITTVNADGQIEVQITRTVTNHKFSVELLNGRYIQDTSAQTNEAVEFAAENVKTTTTGSVDAILTH